MLTCRAWLHTPRARKDWFQVRKKRYKQGSLQPYMIGGRKVWYAQWWESRNRRTKVLGPCSEITKGEAQAQLAAILAPLNENLSPTAGKVVTAGEFIEQQFIPWQELAWKQSTAMTTTQRIRALILPAFKNKLLRAITREDLQKFLFHQAQTHAESVVRHLRWDLNSIFSLAHADGLTALNPASELRVPRRCKEGRTKRALTEEEVIVYLRSLELPERVMARLAIFEGMRPGEIYSLRWEDVQDSAAAVGCNHKISVLQFQHDFDRLRRLDYWIIPKPSSKLDSHLVASSFNRSRASSKEIGACVACASSGPGFTRDTGFRQ